MWFFEILNETGTDQNRFDPSPFSLEHGTWIPAVRKSKANRRFSTGGDVLVSQ